MTLLDLIEYTYLAGGFTTKSDFARAEADLIAQASSVGFLTTQTPRDGFLSVWRLTPQALVYMWESSGDVPADDDTLPGENPPETFH